MAVWFNRLTYAGLGLTGVGLIADQVLFDVDGGERAVMFDKTRGILPDVLGEGTHFRIPGLQDPKIYDVKMNFKSMLVTTPSQDLQNVTVNLRVLFRPEIPKLPWLFENYGMDYAEKVIPSIGNEILKSVIAQYHAEHLITMREDVSQKIASTLQKRAKDFHILVDDVALTELRFTRAFNESVESKQVAEQEAERAGYNVERAQFENQASIIRAEGDAEAAIMISEALAKNGQALIELRKIEAAKEIAATMARSPNVAYLPGGQNVLMNMRM